MNISATSSSMASSIIRQICLSPVSIPHSSSEIRFDFELNNKIEPNLKKIETKNRPRI
jgi:hypothetical protein